MGCTSSAPNMGNSNTAEKSIQFEEMSDDHSKDTEEIIYRAGKDTNGITTSSDTLSEPIRIVRNRSSPSLNTEKENQEHIIHFSETINKSNSSITLRREENVPKLEEVVEKVVELYSSEKENSMQNILKIEDDSQKSDDHNHISNVKSSNDHVEDNEKHAEIEHVKDKEEEEHVEEAISPSQSESSRATRWEALADIAAELPPSLTVDPITGQIFAVAK